MKTQIGNILAIGVAVLAASGDAQAGVLQRILNNVRSAAQQGLEPVVVFDLDDTLFDTRYRMASLLHDIGRSRAFASAHPIDAARLRALHVNDLGYYVGDALKRAGIDDPEALAEIHKYFDEQFKSNEYVRNDRAYPGAAAYTRALANAGATVVYLTGRDVPRMKDGTLEALHANRFAIDPAGTNLIMMNEKSGDILQFKRDQMIEIGKRRIMIASFENEPKNINMMRDVYPDASMVLLETIHSNDPTKPHPDVVSIPGYLRRAQPLQAPRPELGL